MGLKQLEKGDTSSSIYKLHVLQKKSTKRSWKTKVKEDFTEELSFDTDLEVFGLDFSSLR